MNQAVYHYRANKHELGSDLEIPRIESDSRFLALAERKKGEFQVFLTQSVLKSF